MNESRLLHWLSGAIAALVLLAVVPSCAAGGQVVEVKSSAGIDGAIRAAVKKGPGTTVHFRAGSYTHGRMEWPNGIHLRGDGIGKTKLNFGIEFGSRSRIGGSGASMGLTIGSTREDSRFHLRNGAHGTRFQWVRFRSRGWVLWNICDYTSYWSDGVVRSRGNAHDIVWVDCEFEYTGDPDGTTFNIWWDARRGGGNIYNLTWKRCTFGVRNSSGAYGSGEMGLLIQPSPPEHAQDGPRPPTPSDPGGIRSTRHSFDFDQVTHGSGRAAVGGRDGYGFRIWDSRFVGPARFTSIDICDFIRAWAMVTYGLSRPSAVTDAMKAAAPDRVTTKGVQLRNVWMSSELVREYGRGVTLDNVRENQGESTYNVRAIVRAHDKALYGD